MKIGVNKYKQYLSSLEPRSINISAYSKWLERYVKCLASLPMEESLETVLDFVGKYTVHFARQEQESGKKLSPDPILGEVEWAIDITIKNKFGKNERFGELLNLALPKNLAQNITNKALKLSRNDGIDFVGELVGTWILTYPLKEIDKEEKIQFPSPWAVDDEDYVYILRRSLLISFLEWRK